MDIHSPKSHEIGRPAQRPVKYLARSRRQRSTPRGMKDGFQPADADNLKKVAGQKHLSEAGKQARLYAELIGVSEEASALLGRGIVDPTSRARAIQCLETSPACARLRRNSMNHAKFLAALGARDDALDALESYAAQRDSTHPEGVWWPVFESVRGTPRFKSIMKMTGLPYTPKDLPGA